MKFPLPWWERVRERGDFAESKKVSGQCRIN
jgi:hypothetical protein